MNEKSTPGGVRARDVALKSLIEIETGGSFANLVKVHHLSALDRSLTQELVNGITRRRGTIDWVLGRFLTRPLESLTPSIRNILRLGVYQLMFLDRIPARAAVHESVQQAHRFGHAGVAKLVNGVLRSVIRQQETIELPDFSTVPLESLIYCYSLPRWLAEHWLDVYGSEAERLGKWSITPPRIHMRVNSLRVTRDDVLNALKSAGVDAHSSPATADGIRLTSSCDITQLPGYQEGWWYVQDDAAMLVSQCLSPQPGETIIEIGAAPGGKTTHVAQLMNNSGAIFAVDQFRSRLQLLEANAERLGATCITPVERDARSLAGLPMADRILLDVPCSGLGVLPRKPDIRWRQTPEQSAQLVEIQLALLEAATQNLKPGGTLVYSTCTIGTRENQDVIAAFLARHPDYRLSEIAPFIPQQFREDIEREGMLQLLPHRHEVDGFFIARLTAPGGS